MMAGARPVFADIDPARLTIDPERDRRARSPRGRARSCRCISTDRPPTWRRSSAIAARHELAVVEDCCQAHLATAGGRAGRHHRRRRRVQLLSDQESRRARRRRRRRHQRSRARGARQAAAQRRPDRPVPSSGARRQLAARRNAGRDPARAAAVPRAAGPRGAGALAARTARRWRPPPVDAARPKRDPGHVYHLFVVRSSRRRARRRATAAASGRERASRRWCTIRCRFHGSRRWPRTHPADCPRAAARVRRSPLAAAPSALGDHELAAHRGVDRRRHSQERTDTSASVDHRRGRIHRLASCPKRCSTAATRC